MFRRKNHNLAQPGDIAFLLILFFLLLAGLESSRAIDLQCGSRQSSQPTKQTCLLVLTDKGTVLYGSEELTAAECASVISDCQTVRLFVEPNVPWQNVVDVLAIANEQGKEVSLNET